MALKYSSVKASERRVKSQTAVQSQLAAEASYETNAHHLLQINLFRFSALFLLLDSI